MAHREVTSHESQVEGWKVHPLTPDRWDDLEALFGPRGACAGCWCMWWRLTGPQYKEGKGDSNKEAFERIVKAGETPGLLGYAGGKPVGWCAIAPRDAYERLQTERIRILKKVDVKPVWSVT